MLEPDVQHVWGRSKSNILTGILCSKPTECRHITVSEIFSSNHKVDKYHLVFVVSPHKETDDENQQIVNAKL